MKRLLLFAALFAATAFSANAYDFSAVSPSGHTLYYTIVNGEAQVTYQNTYSPRYSNISGDLIIPGYVSHNNVTYIVTSIGSLAFEGCGLISSITFPETITEIGSGAFKANSNRISLLTIPSSITQLGDCSFQDRTINKVVINANCVSMGSSYPAFSDSNIDTLIIGNNVTLIPNNAFKFANVFNIIIGASVVSIGEYAFAREIYYNRNDSIKSIRLYTTTPPQISGTTFRTLTAQVPIRIPCVALQAFINNWGGQFNFNCYSLNHNLVVNASDSIRGNGNYISLSDSIAEITATANPGYHFLQWNDGDTNNPRIITLTQDTVFTAIFAKNRYSVAGAANDSIRGIVFGGATVDYLDTVTLTAVANYGYHFVQWDDGCTDNPRQIVAADNIIKTATFAVNQYQIMVQTDTAFGIVTVSSGYVLIDSYTSLSLSNFTQMTSSTTAPAGDNFFRYIVTTQITNGSNQYCYYRFVNASGTKEWRFTPITTTPGAIEYNSHSGNNELFTNITIGHTITYNDLGGIKITYSNIGWIIEFPESVYCNQREYNASYTTVYWGNPPVGFVYMGEYSVSATSNYGYHFSHWNDGDTNNPRVITLTQDTSFTAFFAPNQYTLTLLNANLDMGSVEGGGTYDYHDTVIISATAVEHHHFVQWSDGNRDNPRQYLITGDASLTANFAIDTHTVNVNANDIVRGSVTSTGTRFVYGTPCTVAAAAYTGYTFHSWSNGVTANPYTFAVMNDMELTAIFLSPDEMCTVTVVSANPTMGAATVDGSSSTTVMSGEEVTLTATPYAGYRFVQWQDNDTHAHRTVTVTSTITYTAYFAPLASIRETEGDNNGFRVFAYDGQIVVEGAEGMPIMLYDATGRLLATRKSEEMHGGTPVQFNVPASDTYLIKVGNRPARKVVVIR